MDTHETYMNRCLTLAKLGAGRVAPNPMVGAVLVHEGRIIGEGFHERYGGPHAEVNCIASVEESDQALVPFSTLYVSLEPCAHHGKTPPCADLIIQNGIRKVVVGCGDPFTEVDGRGIRKLENAGVSVIHGVLEEGCRELNRRFLTAVEKKRPFVVLKWAQTKDKKIGHAGPERLLISNKYTNRLVHRWRSEEAAILVGTNTALKDDPVLDNRLWTGPGPVRLLLDRSSRLPASLKVFDGSRPTIVFSFSATEVTGQATHVPLRQDADPIPQVIEACHAMQIQSILVEGGARLLQGFIDSGLWDEARVITAAAEAGPEGIQAPELIHASCEMQEEIASDNIHYYRNKRA